MFVRGKIPRTDAIDADDPFIDRFTQQADAHPSRNEFREYGDHMKEQDRLTFGL